MRAGQISHDHDRVGVETESVSVSELESVSEPELESVSGHESVLELESALNRTQYRFIYIPTSLHVHIAHHVWAGGAVKGSRFTLCVFIEGKFLNRKKNILKR